MIYTLIFHGNKEEPQRGNEVFVSSNVISVGECLRSDNGEVLRVLRVTHNSAGGIELLLVSLGVKP